MRFDKCINVLLKMDSVSWLFMAS